MSKTNQITDNLNVNNKDIVVNPKFFYRGNDIVKIWEQYLTSIDHKLKFYAKNYEDKPEIIGSIFNDLTQNKEACLVIKNDETLYLNKDKKSISLCGEIDYKAAGEHTDKINQTIELIKAYNKDQNHETKITNHLIIFPYHASKLHWNLGVIELKLKPADESTEITEAQVSLYEPFGKMTSCSDLVASVNSLTDFKKVQLKQKEFDHKKQQNDYAACGAISAENGKEFLKALDDQKNLLQTTYNQGAKVLRESHLKEINSNEFYKAQKDNEVHEAKGDRPIENKQAIINYLKTSIIKSENNWVKQLIQNTQAQNDEIKRNNIDLFKQFLIGIDVDNQADESMKILKSNGEFKEGALDLIDELSEAIKAPEFSSENDALIKGKYMSKNEQQNQTKITADQSAALTEKTLLLIEEGSRKIAKEVIKENVMLVLGATGIGKSTLINYISGQELKIAQGKFFGPNISESTTKSATFYSNIITPELSEFSYIDGAGFYDSRGAEYEIAGAYFRKKVTENAKQIKVLLVIPYSDFTDTSYRGEGIRKVVGYLDKVFDMQGSLEQLKQAISLIVTKVDKVQLGDKPKKLEEKQEVLRKANVEKNEGLIKYIEQEIKEIKREITKTELENNSIKNTIKSGLENFKNDENISASGKAIINYIVDNSNFALFSKPNEDQNIDNTEKDQIISLLNKTFYAAKDKIEIITKVDGRCEVLVKSAADKAKKTAEEFITDILEEKIKQQLPKNIENQPIKILKDRQQELEKYSQKSSYDSLQNLTRAIFKVFAIDDQDNLINQATKLNKVIEFLDSLHGITNDDELTNQKNANNYRLNISNALRKFVEDDLISALEKNLTNKVTVKIIDNLKQGVAKILSEASNIEEITKVKNKLNGLKLNNKSDFEEFAKKITDLSLLGGKHILDHMEKMLLTLKFLKCFLGQSYDEVSLIRNLNIESKIKIDLTDELEKINEEVKDFSSKNKTILKSYFPKTSEINKKINEKSDRPESIEIQALNTLILDESLDSEKFKGVNLSITAAKWNVVNEGVKIDLSGREQTNYPNDKNKADNAITPGSKGGDGIAGLPGESGGNFYGLIDKSINTNKLTVVSNGGKGGPGQGGGDGATASDSDDLARYGINPDGKAPYNENKEFWDKGKLNQNELKLCQIISDKSEENVNKWNEAQHKDKNWHYHRIISHDNPVQGKEVSEGEKITYHHEAIYSEPKVGGNSGKIGAGGKGGLKGIININNFNGNENKINSLSNNGISGDIGEIGTAGEGGRQAVITGKSGIKKGVVTAFNGLTSSSVPYQDHKWKEDLKIKTSSGVCADIEEKFIYYTLLRASSGSQLTEVNLESLPSEPTAVKPINERQKIANYLKSLYQQDSKIKAANFSYITKQLIKSNFSSAIDIKDLTYFLKEIGLEPQKFVDEQDFYDFHRQFQNQLQNIFESNKDASKDDIEILNYLYATSKNCTYKLRTSKENVLVVDISKYLDLVQRNTKELKKYIIKDSKDRIKKEYQDNLDKKITEAKDSVATIRNDINKYEKSVDKNIKKLVEEIIDLKKENIGNENKLLKYKTELEKLIPIKAMFGVLNVGCAALSFLGPKGAAAGAIISSSLNIGKGFIIKEPKAPGAETSKPPSSVNKNLTNISKALEDLKTFDEVKEAEPKSVDKDQQKKIAAKDKEFKAEKEQELKDLQASEPSNEEVRKAHYLGKEFIEERKNEIEELEEDKEKRKNDPSPESLEEVSQIEKQIEELYENIEKKQKEIDTSKKNSEDKEKKIEELKKEIDERKAQDARSTDQDYKKESKKETDKIKAQDAKSTAKILEKLQAGVDTAKAAAGVFQELTAAYGQVEEARQALDKNKQLLTKLDAKQDQIIQLKDQLTKNITSSVEEVAKNLSDKSHVKLDIEKWHIKSYLEEIKLILNETTEGFKSNTALLKSVDIILKGVETLIQIYDRIQTYEEQAEFAVYISDLSSDSIKHQDSECQKDINQVKKILQFNIVIQQYEKAMQAFAQWAFPFVDHYIKEAKLPIIELDKEPMQDQNSNLSAKIDEAITKLSKVVSEHQAVIYPKRDNLIESSNFNNVDHTYPPFYEWSYQDYNIEIKEIFKMKQVRLDANCQSFKRTREAIKFKSIGILVACDDSKINAELQTELEKFNVEMEHLGNNHYLYNNALYKIDSSSGATGKNENIKFIHNYGSGKKLVNNSFEKYEGKSLLSPYASWRIAFTQRVENKDDAQKLTNILDKVKDKNLKIMLVGEGTYLKISKAKDKNIDLDLVSPLYQKLIENLIVDKMQDAPFGNLLADIRDELSIEDFTSFSGKLSVVERGFVSLSKLKINSDGSLSDELKILITAPKQLANFMANLEFIVKEKEDKELISQYKSVLQKVQNQATPDNQSLATELVKLGTKTDNLLQKDLTKLKNIHLPDITSTLLNPDEFNGYFVEAVKIESFINELSDLSYNIKSSIQDKTIGDPREVLNFLIKAMNIECKILSRVKTPPNSKDIWPPKLELITAEDKYNLHIEKNAVLIAADQNSNQDQNESWLWVASLNYRYGSYLVSYLVAQSGDESFIAGNDQNVKINAKQIKQNSLPLNLDSFYSLLDQNNPQHQSKDENLEDTWGKTIEMILVPSKNVNSGQKLQTSDDKLLEPISGDNYSYIEANDNSWYAAPVFILFLLGQMQPAPSIDDI